MINSFKDYLVTEEKTAYFIMDGFNPPANSHGSAMNSISEAAHKNPYKVFVSQVSDSNKNPLLYKEKVKHLRKMFPKHARSVVMDSTIRTPVDVAVKLFNEGYKRIVVLGEADRLREHEILLEKYNGKDSDKEFYHFESMKFIRITPTGANSQRQIDAALNEDFSAFAQGIPNSVNNADARNLFNAVRKGLGLKERKEFKRHVQLTSVSETREAFVNGSLFTEGEEVVIKKTDMVGKISVLGSNYVIVETSEGKTRQWLEAVEKIVPDYGTPESTAKAKKMTPGQKEDCWDGYKQVGMKPKGKKMVPNCVAEYGGPKISRKTYLKQDPMKENSTQPAKVVEGDKKGLWHNIHQRRKKGLPAKKPGDKGYPKTLNIEDTGPITKARDVIAKDKSQASDMIAREREKDKLKHDKLLDRARRAVMLNKNRGVSND